MLRPGPLKKPPPAAAGAPSPGLPGWVMVRLNGCAVPGAVEVLGGAEKVRAPREPELKPPPIRASAGEIADINGSASARVTAIAWTMPRARCVNFMASSLKSPAGEAPLRWAAMPKSEAINGKSGCGPRSRGCGNRASSALTCGSDARHSGAMRKHRTRNLEIPDVHLHI